MSDFLALLFVSFVALFYVAHWFFVGRILSAKVNVNGGMALLSIAGCVFPPLGAVIGCWYVLAGPTARRQSTTLEDQLRGLADDQLVDWIDQNSTASVIASNSEWLRRNWHVMSDRDKQKWVSDRREHLLKYLPSVVDAPTFVNAVQQADKDFARNGRSAA